MQVAFPNAKWASKTFEGVILEIIGTDGREAEVYISHPQGLVDKVTVLVSYIYNNYEMLDDLS